MPAEPEPTAAEPEPAIAEPSADPPEPVAAEPEPVIAEPEPSAVPDPPLSFLQAGPITKQSPSNAVAIRMPRMLPAIALCSAALAAVLPLAPARGDSPPDVKLPPGTRADASGQLVSSRGLRDTTDFLTRELDRRGIAVTKIGPVRVRGVELTRFLSQTATTPWLAIHVLRTSGKTMIFFVARPAS